jgi:hypothetical protein
MKYPYQDEQIEVIKRHTTLALESLLEHHESYILYLTDLIPCEIEPVEEIVEYEFWVSVIKAELGRRGHL